MKPYVSAKDLRTLFVGGIDAVEQFRDSINDLNVFPVPDGDTGTNMYLTLQSVKALMERENPTTFPHLGSVIASGSLTGARGNSGVILSQIFKGFGNYLKKFKGDQMKPEHFIEMLDCGRKVAYSSVVKPVEGTILTLIRRVAEELYPVRKKYVDFESMFRDLIKIADETVKLTPTMLDVLAEAGVVDAGAFGLTIFFKGMESVLTGEEVVMAKEFMPDKKPTLRMEGESKYPFCTECSVVFNEKFDLEDYLSAVGDSIVIGKDGDVVHFHVHTDKPLEVLSEIAKHGRIIKIKVDNMDAQMEGLMAEQEKKDIAIVAVADGDGWAEILQSLGVDVIVSGGQTMNPSVRQLADSVKHAPADTVILLPNNKNIVGAAHQVDKVVKKNVYVIPTHSMQEAVAILMNLEPGMHPDEILKVARDVRDEIVVGSITTAVRKSKIKGKNIDEGMALILVDDDLLDVADDVDSALAELVKYMVSEKDVSMISVFVGEDKDVEKTEELMEEIIGDNDDVEYEVHYGGQKVYPYMVLGEV